MHIFPAKRQNMTETASIDEQYTSATNTSNMRVEADRRGDADLVIAAGWSNSRLGMTLLRLHTRITNGGLSDAHEQLTIYATRCRIESPDVVASGVLAWFLDHICPTCHGRKFDAIPGTPSLSAIECPKCHGTGEVRLPHGEAGRKVSNHIDDCLYRARQSLKSRLHRE
jgi:hypothetical protein